MADVWSPIATETERYRTRRKGLPAFKGTPVGVIMHTTGSGIVRRAIREDEDPLVHAAKYYRSPTSYTSHYLIGRDFSRADVIVGIVPEQLVAYHSSLPTKSKRFKHYGEGRSEWPHWRIVSRGTMKRFDDPQPHFDEWLSRWPELGSPLELQPNPRRGLNRQFLGIDWLPGERGEMTEQQARWAASLIGELSERHGFEVSKTTVLRHSDVDPYSRTNKAGGWDPPRAVFEMLCEILGIEGWPTAANA